MSVLNFALPLKPFETATSYTSRLAELCKAGNANELCRDLGIEWQAVVRGDDHALARIARFGGVATDVLAKWAVRARNNKKEHLRFEVCGHLVINKTMTRSRMRVCPKCILDDIKDGGFIGVHRRLFWQFYAIRTCSKHACPLIFLPPEKYTINNYDICRLVRKNHQFIVDAASHTERIKGTEFEAYLVDRLKGERNYPFLDSLEIHIVAHFAQMLGVTLSLPKDIPLRSVTEDQLRAACQSGFAVLKKGEAAFLEKLGELNTSQNFGQSTHSIDLGYLFSWLTRARFGEDINPLKDLIRKYIFEHYPVPKGMKVLGEPCEEVRIYSVFGACKELKVSHEKFGRIAETMNIGHLNGSKKRVALDGFLTSETLSVIKEQARDRLEENLLPRDAVKLLGAPHHIYKSIRRLGLISSHSDEIDFVQRYRRKDLEEFLGRLVANTKPLGPEHCDRIALAKAPPRYKIPAARFLEMILAGEIMHANMCHDVPRIDSLTLSLRELDSKLLTGPITHVNFTTASQLLRLCIPSLRHLVEQGQLNSVPHRHPLSGFARPSITTASLEAFVAKHVTLGRLSKAMNEAPNVIKGLLDFYEIKPVGKLSNPGWVFDRNRLKQQIASLGLYWPQDCPDEFSQ